MDELTQRETRVVESLLENEALTDNLDDEAAQALLDWGIGYTRQIAQSTAGLNEAQAEVAMEQKLQATRRLLRLVNNHFDPAKQAEYKTNPWAAREANLHLLQQVVEQVSIILGEQFHPPGSEQLAAVAAQWTEQNLSARALIEHLRQFIEQQSVSGAGDGQTDQGGSAGVASSQPISTAPAPAAEAAPGLHPVTTDRPALQARLLGRLRAFFTQFLP